MNLVWMLLAVGIARVAYLVWDELKNSTYIWRDPCITAPETRQRLKFVLESFGRAARGTDLVWWLDYGTLLGAWRLSDIMAYDFDLDLGYLAEHRSIVEEIAGQLAPLGIEINFERTSIFLDGQKMGDIEPWYESGGVLRRDADPSQRGGALKWSREWHDDFPRRWLEPRREILLADRFYPCPSQVEQLLRRRYPTCWLSLRMPFPHKQRCWFCYEYWREAWRIWRYRAAPVFGQEITPAHETTSP